VSADARIVLAFVVIASAVVMQVTPPGSDGFIVAGVALFVSTLLLAEPD
jgi:hypothetical protein